MHSHDHVHVPSLALNKRVPIRLLQEMGLVPTLDGSARGYNAVSDVITQTADGRDLTQIWSEFQASLVIQNRYRDTLVNLLTFPVTTPIEDVPQAVGDDFEEASEFGVPKGIRGAAYFSLGYDFKWYDIAVRFTWMYLAEASAGQVESLHNQVLAADSRLMLNKVLKAVLNNLNRTASIRQQAVTVYPFYNADGTVPPQYKNYTFLGTHQHYITSGAAVVDSQDLKDMLDTIKHHGYTTQGGATLILLANPQEVTTIRGFKTATGALWDFIPAQGSPPFYMPQNTAILGGGQPPATYQGLNVAGRYGDWLVIEEDYIPAGYMIGFATGGEAKASNPVGIREHANASLRGLRLVKGPDPDYPLVDSYYNHGFGTGVRQRGAGVVMQVTAAGTYTIPTNYT
jgi:hypothetical protein